MPVQEISSRITPVTMNNAGPVNIQTGDVRAYEAMTAVVSSNLPTVLTPFKAVSNPKMALAVMMDETFLNEFLDSANQFCELSCSQAAMIMRQCALLPEIRGLPTASLAGEIRKEVFESLDRIATNFEGLRTELDNLTVLLNAGRINDPARRHQGILLLRKSQSLIVGGIGEYLGKIEGVAERLLDYCFARSFGAEISFERQHAAMESVQREIREKINPIIRVFQGIRELDQTKIEADEEEEGEEPKVKAKSWQNDASSPKLWLVFLTALGLVALLIILSSLAN
jgi:hypothetical protein